jgi:hypothetical protein
MYQRKARFPLVLKQPNIAVAAARLLVCPIYLSHRRRLAQSPPSPKPQRRLRPFATAVATTRHCATLFP